MIPVTDTLLVYEKELKHSKAIPLKTTGIRIIKMEPFDSTHYLIINNAWKIKLLNKHTGEITDSPFGESSNAYDLYKDSSGHYWVSFYGQGVKCYNQDGQLLTSYNTRNSNLSNDIVLDITEWNKTIWLATDGGGVNIIYPDTRDIQILSNKENRQFPANSVTCLCHSNNHMWIGMVREGVLGAEKALSPPIPKLHKTQPQVYPTNAPYVYGKTKTDESGLVQMEAASTALTRKRNILPTIRKHWEKR